ncbi:MAG TPA: hypothetical protein VD764_03415 [Nocardioides sp.]|nr:hypothetical protein [Nocardioides sp.]
MTKKGYQKRLPKVLPPPVHAPPAVPAPRGSVEDSVREAVQEPVHEPVREPVREREPAPVQVPVREPVQEPVREPVDESVPVDVQVTRPAPAIDTVPARRKPAPATAPPHRRRFAGRTVAVVALILVGPLVAGLVGAFMLLRPDKVEDTDVDPGNQGASGVGSAALSADESYVETRVLPTGELVVRQRIRPDQPVRRLRLALPEVPGAEVLSAHGVEVVADGEPVDGEDILTDRAADYVFDASTDLQIRYRLDGAVEFSDSVTGRALALATSLHVAYAPLAARETRVVSAAEVLSLACTRTAAEPPVPCGEASGDDRWSVELEDPRVTDRVMAQVNLQ